MLFVYEIYIKYPHTIFRPTGLIKGQLISKANFQVFISTKKPTKKILYFQKPLKKWSKQEIKVKTNLMLFIIYLMEQSLFYIFLIWPLLEAKAETQNIFIVFSFKCKV